MLLPHASIGRLQLEAEALEESDMLDGWINGWTVGQMGIYYYNIKNIL